MSTGCAVGELTMSSWADKLRVQGFRDLGFRA